MCTLEQLQLTICLVISCNRTWCGRETTRAAENIPRCTEILVNSRCGSCPLTWGRCSSRRRWRGPSGCRRTRRILVQTCKPLFRTNGEHTYPCVTVSPRRRVTRSSASPRGPSTGLISKVIRCFGSIPAIRVIVAGVRIRRRCRRTPLRRFPAVCVRVRSS